MQHVPGAALAALDFDDDTIRRVIEAMPVGVIVADASGRIVLANAHGCRLLGYAPGELFGRPVEELVPMRVRASHVARREGYAARPAERPMGAGLELYAVRRDGTEVPVEVGLNPIVSGGARFTLATVSDMSERRALEDQRLEVNVARQRQFDLEVSLQHEYRRVAALQSAFAQRPFPKIRGIAFESVYRPAASDIALGGDWHDVFILPNGSVAISIGDVSGHGLDAALEMLHIREVLRAGSLSTVGSPAAAMEATNRMVADLNGVVATALLAYYEPASCRMTVACAGHPAPIRIRAAVATTIGAHGVMLGADSDSTFDDVVVDLIESDGVAFYTDGLTESEHRPIDGETRLLDELSTYRSGGLDRLVDALLINGQPDDATLLLMSVAA